MQTTVVAFRRLARPTQSVGSGSSQIFTATSGPWSSLMSIKQVCLVIVINLLAGTFLAWLKHTRGGSGVSLVLITMILLGFAMIWQSVS